jgi:hypothetical protein
LACAVEPDAVMVPVAQLALLASPVVEETFELLLSLPQAARDATARVVPSRAAARRVRVVRSAVKVVLRSCV